jgi:hypothetical protein
VPEGDTVVERLVETGVASDQQVERIGRIDPDDVVVGVLVLAGLGRFERRAAVGRHMQEHIDLIHLRRVDGGGEELLVVVRPGAAGDVAAAAFPRAAPVGGAVAAPILRVGWIVFGRFDRGVDDRRVGGGDGEADLAEVVVRSGETDGCFRPSAAAIGRRVDARARTAAHVRLHRSAALKGGGHERVGVVGRQRDRRDAGVGVGLASVCSQVTHRRPST